MKTIKVRKPKQVSFSNFREQYKKDKEMWDKYLSSLPKKGERIKITWFPDDIGVMNDYTGREGVVGIIDTTDGSFSLDIGEAILSCGTDFDYVKL